MSPRVGGSAVFFSKRNSGVYLLAASLTCAYLAPLGLGGAYASSGGMQNPPAASAQPIVVELFTSEGCNTCPPADALLAQIADKELAPGVRIIAFEEHVDYWNHDGWTDPFSSHLWTERQSSYEPFVNRSPDAIYTPQLIVDGNHEAIGSDGKKVAGLLSDASKQPKAPVKLSAVAGSVAVQISIAGGADTAELKNADVFLAITETGLQSNVTAGENAGKMLKHAAVLRRLDKIGSPDKKTNAFAGTVPLKLNDSWKKENLRVVVFVQERKSRQIVGAAEIAPFATGSAD